MTPKNKLTIIRWVVSQGLEGTPETELLPALCARLAEAGVSVLRANIYQPTLHPMIGGHIFYWWKGAREATQESWNRVPIDPAIRANPSPFEKMIVAGDPSMRHRLDVADLAELPLLETFRAKGGTDYFALQSRFGGAHVVGPVDRILTSWVSDAPGGFSGDDLAAIGEIAPVLALVAKDASTHRIAETVLETYLGRDAGKRVLDGNVQRGQGDSIRAALWSCDLQGFTKLADKLPRDELMALLDDYFDAMVTTLHDVGGQVLKFMGDGLLAIFSLGSDADCCAASLTAAEQALQKVDALTSRRQAKGLPVSRFYIALHLGEVMFGNIGAQNRLDFTVVGPAVNEVSRIESMCRSLDQSLVISQAFAEATSGRDSRLVSLGRYALRGVTRPQELFTLDLTAQAIGR